MVRRTKCARIFQLGGLLEGALDEGQAALGLFAEKFFAVAAIFLDTVEFIGNRQRGQDGYFLRVNGRRGACDRVHFFVNVLREFVDIGFVKFAANGVGLPEYLNFYGTAHVW